MCIGSYLHRRVCVRGCLSRICMHVCMVWFVYVCLFCWHDVMVGLTVVAYCKGIHGHATIMMISVITVVISMISLVVNVVILNLRL